MFHVKKSLKMIHSGQIILHEYDEPVRLEQTLQSIKLQRMLKNPISVIELENGKYLVIDGVHRFKSLIKLGYKKIPCQVVDVSQFELHAWAHMVKIGRWLDEILSDQQLEIKEHKIDKRRCIVKLVNNNGQEKYIYMKPNYQSDLNLLVKKWNFVVNTYLDKEEITRIGDTDVHDFRCDDNYIVLIFPKLSLNDITMITKNGHLLPTGFTRFLISGRILNLQIPLSMMMQTESTQKEWDELTDKWSTHMRYYSEPIYIYE